MGRQDDAPDGDDLLGSEGGGDDPRDDGVVQVHAVRVEHAGVLPGRRRGGGSCHSRPAVLPGEARCAAVLEVND